MKAPFGTAARSDVWLTLGLAVLGIAATVWDLVTRLIEVVPNEDVPVDVQVFASQQSIAVEGVGDAVPVELERFTVHVSDLPVGTYVSAIGAALAPAVATVTVLVCVAWLLFNIGGGRFFSRLNTRLVTTAALAVVIGWVVTAAMTTAAANGALAQLSSESDAGFEITAHISFLYLFAAMVAGCIAAAFHTGERMQRDSEGLV